MSYTFSRRDFMKYTVLAAAAVAVSGSLTGCSNNPNQPSKVFNKADTSLSFGGTSGFFGSSDVHTLKAAGTSYDEETRTLTCAFEHTPVSEGTSCSNQYYRVRIDKEDGPHYYIDAADGVSINASNKASPIEIKNAKLPILNTLTITGIDFSDAEKVYIQYFPRHTALGNDKDSYSDVFATWDITCLFAAE